MFVKVIREVSESLYECNRYHKVETEDNNKAFTVTLENDKAGPAVSFTLDPDADGRMLVFVLNDEGQTIDRLFSKHK